MSNKFLIPLDIMHKVMNSGKLSRGKMVLIARFLLQRRPNKKNAILVSIVNTKNHEDPKLGILKAYYPRIKTGKRPGYNPQYWICVPCTNKGRKRVTFSKNDKGHINTKTHLMNCGLSSCECCHTCLSGKCYLLTVKMSTFPLNSTQEVMLKVCEKCSRNNYYKPIDYLLCLTRFSHPTIKYNHHIGYNRPGIEFPQALQMFYRRNKGAKSIHRLIISFLIHM